MPPKTTSTTVAELSSMPAAIVQRLTARPGRVPVVKGHLLRLRPEVYEGPIALQVLARSPHRIDVRVRFEEDGRVQEYLRRVLLVHHRRQLAGLAVGEWSAGHFKQMRGHGRQWAPLPHKAPRRT